MLFSPAASSADTGLYELIADVSRKYYPDAGIVSSVAAGFTDSHFFRDLGIISYGYAPILIPPDAVGSVHGNNERINIDSFNQGVTIMTEIVEAFATER